MGYVYSSINNFWDWKDSISELTQLKVRTRWVSHSPGSVFPGGGLSVWPVPGPQMWLRALSPSSLKHLNKTSGLGQKVGPSTAAKQNQAWSSLWGTSKCSWSGLMAFPNSVGEEGGKFFPRLALKSNRGKFCCLDDGILKCLAKARIYKKLSLIYKN